MFPGHAIKDILEWAWGNHGGKMVTITGITAGTASSDEPRRTPGYDGQGRQVAGIALMNGLLGLVTLGIYRFWGKTRLRRFLWAQVSFDGDRMEYTGRALELLFGFLIAIFILMLLVFAFEAVGFVAADNEIVLSISSLIYILVFTFLIQVAIYRARRYRLSRTQWRGIRGGQSGSAVKYALRAFGWSLVAFFTLGIAYNVMRNRLQRYRTQNTWIGDRHFEFGARATAMLGPWLIAWLLLIPTLGMSYIWYRVREFRYFAAHTRYGAVRFDSVLGTGRVIWIYLRYYLVLAVVLVFIMGAVLVMVPGLFGVIGAWTGGDEAMMETIESTRFFVPLALIIVYFLVSGVVRVALLVHPMLREICWSLRVAGDEDFEAIAQSRQYTPPRGEGLADALDVGSI